MGTDTEPVADGVAVRASALSAVATMAVIALVSVSVVMVWARVSSGSSEGEGSESGIDEPVPDSLAGGIAPAPVPDAVTAAFDQPVVGAARLDELPPDVSDECSDTFGEVEWEEGQPTLQSAIATPDAIHAVLEGKGSWGPDMGGGGEAPERFRTTCSAHSEGDRWMTEGNGFQPVFGEGDVVEDGMGSGYSCCDENGLATATQTIAVPDGAAWGIQERSGWYLAYPVEDEPMMMLTWKFREQRFGPGAAPQTTVTFVDDAGAVIAEAFAGGQF